MSAAPKALRARYLFPVAGPPMAGGVISIAGGKIVAMGENLSGRPKVDLGNVAILPGLVNAHTHLEFSDLTRPLGAARNRLPEWIGPVIAYRRSATEKGVDARGAGLAECVAGGATSIGEITTSPWTLERDALLAPADVTVFWEVIGLKPEQFAERLAAARAHLERNWPAEGCARPGLSPHAPYSVHLDLLEEVVRLAKAANVPVAMHLAESREELELLADGGGPFRALLEGLGVWSAETFPGGRRPLDYLKRLAEAPRALAIHGNYFDREEIEFLAAKRGTMSVVYCPRTHRYFGHERYPLAEMLERGVNVALGTDSRASNPDLSLLAEMRLVAQDHPAVAPAKVLEMATLSGARALGTGREAGSLEVGKWADLAVVTLPDGKSADPHEMLMDAQGRVEATWHRGTCFTSGNS